MTSWHGKTICIAGGIHKVPLKQGFDVVFAVSLKTIQQTVQLLVIWDMILMWYHCNDSIPYISINTYLFLTIAISHLSMSM